MCNDRTLRKKKIRWETCASHGRGKNQPSKYKINYTAETTSPLGCYPLHSELHSGNFCIFDGLSDIWEQLIAVDGGSAFLGCRRTSRIHTVGGSWVVGEMFPVCPFPARNRGNSDMCSWYPLSLVSSCNGLQMCVGAFPDGGDDLTTEGGTKSNRLGCICMVQQ